MMALLVTYSYSGLMGFSWDWPIWLVAILVVGWLPLVIVSIINSFTYRCLECGCLVMWKGGSKLFPPYNCPGCDTDLCDPIEEVSD